MKIIYLLLISASLCFGQFFGKTHINELIFEGVTADTIGSISSPDTVYIQGWGWPDWKQLTKSTNDTALVTADDKIAENQVQFSLPLETFWVHQKQVRFKIQSRGVSGVDSCVSRWVAVQDLEGVVALDIVPDTTLSRTDYGGSILHGY